MVSVEDKINIFQNELQSQVDQLKAEEIKKATEEAQIREARARLDIENREKAIKNRYKKLEDRNIVRIIAEGKTQARDVILLTKDQIRKNFIKVIQKDTKKYLTSPKYRNYLEKSLEDVRDHLDGSKSLILYIKEAGDINKRFFDDRLEGFEIEYRQLPEEDLGGFIVEDKDGRVNYDYSLYSLIDDNTEKIDFYLEKLVDGELNWILKIILLLLRVNLE